MTNPVELDISSSKADRLEVGKILLANGYRVSTVVRRVKNTRKTLLIVEEMKGANQDDQ